MQATQLKGVLIMLMTVLIWGAGGGIVRLADIGKAFGVSADSPRAPEPAAV